MNISGSSNKKGITLTKEHVSIIFSENGQFRTEINHLNFGLNSLAVKTSLILLFSFIFLVRHYLGIIGIFILIPFYVFVLFKITKTNKLVKKYHAAEHMIINLLKRNIDLNMDNLKKESPYNPFCGTSVSAIVIVQTFLFYDNFFVYVLGHFILFNIIMIFYKNVEKKSVKLANFLNPIGTLFQMVFTIGIPEKKHLKMALKCGKKIIDLNPENYSKPFDLLSDVMSLMAYQYSKNNFNLKMTQKFYEETLRTNKL